jgi:hypothetical protein
MAEFLTKRNRQTGEKALERNLLTMRPKDSTPRKKIEFPVTNRVTHNLKDAHSKDLEPGCLFLF